MDGLEKKYEGLLSAITNLIVVQIVSLLVIVGGGWYLYFDLKNRLTVAVSAMPQQGIAGPDYVVDWEALERPHSAVIGSDQAEIVIVEYTDFQCPFCKRHRSGTRADLLEKYGDQIRLVFKNFPLQNIHPEAMLAAIAAQCAKREGKFWEVEELFFENSERLSKDVLVDIGKSVGLSDSYISCVENEDTRAEVERDIEDGKESGITGTPTFLVNGKVLKGALPLSAFEAEISEANRIRTSKK